MQLTGHAGLDLLLRGGVVDRALAVRALEMAQATDAHVIECAVAAGADERRIATFFAERLLVPLVALERLRGGDRARELVPVDMALELFAVPLGVEPDGALLLVMADPTDTHARDEIAFFAGVDVLRAVATVAAIRRGIAATYDIALTARSDSAEAPPRYPWSLTPRRHRSTSCA